MKKRVILLVYLVVLVLSTGCLKQDKNTELKTGRYVMKDAEPVAGTWVLLKENQKFVFSRSATTSYLPLGTYSVEDKKLTLYVNEKESYLFTIDEDKLIFQSGIGARGLIKQGAIFKLSKED